MTFVIDDALLRETGAFSKHFDKGDIVVGEGHTSDFYLYLLQGGLSIFSLTEDGKEFLQHRVSEGNFFGEPAVLLGRPFPGNPKVVSSHAEVLFIRRDAFHACLMAHPEKMLDFTRSIAEKSISKSTSLKNLIFRCPEERILNQLRSYKKELHLEHEAITIPLTRREISNMTGLRVETVIRTVKKMEREGKLRVQRGKILF